MRTELKTVRRAIRRLHARRVSVPSTVVVLAFTCFNHGCASAGHDVNNKPVATLELGQMQSAHHRAVFGDKAIATQQVTTSDGKLEIAKSSYAHANMATAKGRILILEFNDGFQTSVTRRGRSPAFSP